MGNAYRETYLIVEENVPVSKGSSAADHKTPYVRQQYMIAIRKKTYKMAKILNYTQYKAARNNMTIELCRSKYNYENDLATKIKTDNKSFWSYA